MLYNERYLCKAHIYNSSFQYLRKSISDFIHKLYLFLELNLSKWKKFNTKIMIYHYSHQYD